MKLIFKNFKNEETVIGSYATLQELQLAKAKWFRDHNIKAPYIRSWLDDNGRVVNDYGSWSNFLLIEKEREDEQILG